MIRCCYFADLTDDKGKVKQHKDVFVDASSTEDGITTEQIVAQATQLLTEIGGSYYE